MQHKRAAQSGAVTWVQPDAVTVRRVAPTCRDGVCAPVSEGSSVAAGAEAGAADSLSGDTLLYVQIESHAAASVT